MAFDFKKEFKEFYMPKNRPEIVNVPPINYIAVRGRGNPNIPGGAYQKAIGILYTPVSYTHLSFELIVDGKRVDAPPKEMELLYHLALSLIHI